MHGHTQHSMHAQIIITFCIRSAINFAMLYQLRATEHVKKPHRKCALVFKPLQQLQLGMLSHKTNSIVNLWKHNDDVIRIYSCRFVADARSERKRTRCLISIRQINAEPNTLSQSIPFATNMDCQAISPFLCCLFRKFWWFLPCHALHHAAQILMAFWKFSSSYAKLLKITATRSRSVIKKL